jgi:hypothetical protein
LVDFREDPMDYALIRESDNKIINIIVWDGESEWSPPEEHRIEPFDPAVHIFVPEDRV